MSLTVWRHLSKVQDVLPTLAVLALLGMWSSPSYALPAFARQTGQNCLACHAGGQFPELTSYGRLFKLTGYTLGARTLPLSTMAVLDYTNVRNPKDSSRVHDVGADNCELGEWLRQSGAFARYRQSECVGQDA